MSGVHVGIDVGGTSTDIVIGDARTGIIRHWKRASVVPTRNSSADIMIMMVEAAEEWPLGDPSHTPDRTRDRTVLSQREVRARAVVIIGVALEDAPKMRLSECDQVVDALATDRANQPFCKRILPRGTSGDRPIADPHRVNAPLECLAIGAIAITDQILRCSNPWERLGDLPSNPIGGGMRRDIDREEQPAIDANDEPGDHTREERGWDACLPHRVSDRCGESLITA